MRSWLSREGLLVGVFGWAKFDTVGVVVPVAADDDDDDDDDKDDDNPSAAVGKTDKDAPDDASDGGAKDVGSNTASRCRKLTAVASDKNDRGTRASVNMQKMSVWRAPPPLPAAAWPLLSLLGFIDALHASSSSWWQRIAARPPN